MKFKVLKLGGYDNTAELKEIEAETEAEAEEKALISESGEMNIIFNEERFNNLKKALK